MVTCGRQLSWFQKVVLKIIFKKQNYLTKKKPPVFIFLFPEEFRLTKYLLFFFKWPNADVPADVYQQRAHTCCWRSYRYVHTAPSKLKRRYGCTVLYAIVALLLRVPSLCCPPSPPSAALVVIND